MKGKMTGMKKKLFFIAYTSILNGSRDRVFEAYQKTMKSEVMHYLQLNIDNLPPIGVNSMSHFTFFNFGT